MPTIQALKKKLRGIRSTRKIAKAMKTASTVKFSKLNAMFDEYSKYSAEYKKLYDRYRSEYNAYFAPTDPDAPTCLIIMTANKGMCGSFNSEMLKLASELISEAEKPYRVVLCGKKAETYFTDKGLAFDRSFVFADVPKYDEAVMLFEYITEMLSSGRISSVKIAYPKYSNMMSQTPTLCDLLCYDLSNNDYKDEIPPLYFPDRESVIEATANELLATLLFEKILESALGAQAATLMTMRSAYDTATEYSLELEGEMNKKRQSQVTADVIETAAEYSQEKQ